MASLSETASLEHALRVVGRTTPYRSIISHIAAYRRWAVLDGAGRLCAESPRQLGTAIMEFHSGLYFVLVLLY